ncbi:MAG: ACT domain-containing protein [Bacillota bacterium]
MLRYLVLTTLPEKLGVCQLTRGFPIPDWLFECDYFYSITVTADEISIICREDLIPADCPSEKGFRAFKVEGPLEFSLTGILASLLVPLAAAEISVFTISTYDTDYIMVKEENLDKAISALSTVAIVRQ